MTTKRGIQPAELGPVRNHASTRSGRPVGDSATAPTLTEKESRIERAAIELHMAKLKRRELYRLAGTCPVGEPAGYVHGESISEGTERCFAAHCHGTLDWEPCEACAVVIAEYRPVRMLVQRLQQKLERAVVARLLRGVR